MKQKRLAITVNRYLKLRRKKKCTSSHGRIQTMRGPRLFLFFPLKIDKDQKKSLHVRRYRVFTEYIGEDKKKSLRCSR